MGKYTILTVNLKNSTFKIHEIEKVKKQKAAKARKEMNKGRLEGD
jgi:hypothetical protein